MGIGSSQCRPGGSHHRVTIWPSDGERLVGHAAAPAKPNPAELSRGRDLEDDGERRLRDLGDSNAVCDAIGGSVRRKAAAKFVAVVALLGGC